VTKDGRDMSLIGRAGQDVYRDKVVSTIDSLGGSSYQINTSHSPFLVKPDSLALLLTNIAHLNIDKAFEDGQRVYRKRTPACVRAGNLLGDKW
jgi:hypothetical protein